MTSTITGLPQAEAEHIVSQLKKHWSFGLHTEVVDFLFRGYGEFMGYRAISLPPPTSQYFVVLPAPDGSGVQMLCGEGIWNAKLSRQGLKEFQRGDVITFPIGEQVNSHLPRRLFYFVPMFGGESMMLRIIVNIRRIDLSLLARSGDLSLQDIND